MARDKTLYRSKFSLLENSMKIPTNDKLSDFAFITSAKHVYHEKKLVIKYKKIN